MRRLVKANIFLVGRKKYQSISGVNFQIAAYRINPRYKATTGKDIPDAIMALNPESAELCEKTSPATVDPKSKRR